MRWDGYIGLQPKGKLPVEAVARMAAKNNIGKASAAALAAHRNQYVRRILEDEDLRGNLLAAYAAGRGVYERMSNGKQPSKALFEDRKLQRELVEAVVALREAGEALKEPPRRQRRRRRGGVGRSLLLVFVAGALAIALSEGLRSKVLDMLFGAEEEFDYSSTTMPAQAAPSSVGAAAA
jgi:hypothetical protein